MQIEPDLYHKILRLMPIPCVDMLVLDRGGRVLLLLRKNEPASGQWWFPGGRVLMGESRLDAAKRKLAEECGLVSTRFREIGTFDLFFNIGLNDGIHSITTLFKVLVDNASGLRLDLQSSEACWLPVQKWLGRELHPFIRNPIAELVKFPHEAEFQSPANNSQS